MPNRRGQRGTRLTACRPPCVVSGGNFAALAGAEEDGDHSEEDEEEQLAEEVWSFLSGFCEQEQPAQEQPTQDDVEDADHVQKGLEQSHCGSDGGAKPPEQQSRGKRRGHKRRASKASLPPLADDSLAEIENMPVAGMNLPAQEVESSHAKVEEVLIFDKTADAQTQSRPAEVPPALLCLFAMVNGTLLDREGPDNRPKTHLADKKVSMRGSLPKGRYDNKPRAQACRAQNRAGGRRGA